MAGGAVRLRRGRQELLLAALAVRPGEAVPAGRLVEDLWPGEQPDDPHNALQHLVAQVRRALGHGRSRLVTVAGGYRLDLTSEGTDVGQVTAALRRAEALVTAGSPAQAADEIDQAVAAWRGEPLRGVDDGPLTGQRTRLTELRAAVDLAAADVALATGDAERLRLAGERLAVVCQEQPLHEGLWQRRIAVLAAQRRGAEALAVYESVRARFAETLGVDPGPELRDLHAELLAVDSQVPPVATAAKPGADRAETPELPALPPTRLFGRDDDLATLDVWHRGDVRLICILGTSGVGKTRLALEFLHRTQRPVQVAQLDLVGEGGDVAAALAAGLMLHQQGTRDLPEVLAESLPDSCVLFLDNAEHVLGQVADLVTTVLQRRRDVTVLVTSQWPLGLAAEHQLRLRALSGTRDPVAAPTATDPVPGAPAASVAAALLLDRAAHVSPALAQPTPDDVRAATTIADLLDGLPLAIELAAAQARHLTLPQLARALTDSLDLLDRETLRSRPRHRSLAHAMQWSLDLLTAGQREFFNTCGVLAGTFDAALISQVSARPESDCLAMLLDLADRSVVHVVTADTTAGPRFCLLRPLRAQALRALELDGSALPIRDRLLDWSLDLVEACDRGVRGPEQLAWLARLDTVRPHLENALTHALATGRVDAAARMVASLGRYWDWRGRLRDADHWTGAVVAATQGREPASVPRLGAVLAWQAFVAIEQGDHHRGTQIAHRGLSLARSVDDLDGQLTSLASLSLATQTGPSLQPALSAVDQAVGLGLARHDSWAYAWSVNRRGCLRLAAGQVDLAEADAQESARQLTALGDVRGVNWATHLHAVIAHARGDHLAARVLAHRALETARALGDGRTAAQVAELLADATDDRAARAGYRELSQELRAARGTRLGEPPMS